jgi:Ni/Fe-hydrogenase subunit HybB-like protein
VWSLYIATFIFWIGMSHSGTLLSAILHIMHADWRKPIYRFAEAMTTFSLMTAGLFVAVHLGRVWNIYWALPYPNERGVWPNFQSPLLWDAMAIFTYLTSSIIFLYIGSIPDLAICRDNTTGWRKKLYTVMSLGWMGTDRQWRNFRKTYLLMACFLIPLAVSVHSIVASDFAMSQQPGWHITSFPPYFVAGALYSGCAAIITLFIILRYTFRFEEYMTLPILDKVARLTFAIAMVWTYLNLIEYASVWYGHDEYSKAVLIQKATGPYAPFWWTMNFCGSIVPFALAFKSLRRHLATMMIVSLLLNLGMWLERWMIVAPTFSHGYYPWTWDHDQWPSFVQWGIVFGSFGWFGLLFMGFCKLIPSVSMYEVKEMVYHRTLERRKGATEWKGESA